MLPVPEAHIDKWTKIQVSPSCILTEMCYSVFIIVKYSLYFSDIYFAFLFYFSNSFLVDYLKKTLKLLLR